MIKAVDPEELWLKAKVFINRALAARAAGSFDDAGVWAASALELLGKAALAHINPLLVADPSDDGKSLLIAAGISSDVQGFRSIQAKTVFSRCARAFSHFSAREAGLIASNRNEEIHSGASPFGGLHEATWWERYWSQAVILLAAQGRTVESFVGVAEARKVEKLLARNSENVNRRVYTLIERARQHFDLLLERAAGGPLRVSMPAGVGSYEFEHEQECPACESPGALFGDYVLSSEVNYQADGPYPVEELVVGADEFGCPYCGLHLQGLEALQAAGLPEQFELEREAEPDWDEYGND